MVTRLPIIHSSLLSVDKMFSILHTSSKKLRILNGTLPSKTRGFSYRGPPNTTMLVESAKTGVIVKFNHHHTELNNDGKPCLCVYRSDGKVLENWELHISM